MTNFELHPQLAADSLAVSGLDLCALRLVNDNNYPWLLLVPQRVGLVDLTDLSRADRITLMDEIHVASEALRTLGRCDKLNVASLGNQVPQLHIHVIARRTDDAAWPRPIWGVAEQKAYEPAEASRIIDTLKRLINKQSRAD